MGDPEPSPRDKQPVSVLLQKGVTKPGPQPVTQGDSADRTGQSAEIGEIQIQLPLRRKVPDKGHKNLVGKGDADNSQNEKEDDPDISVLR